MADITMCKNEGCEIKKECYRYMAKPNPYRQSYEIFDCNIESKYISLRNYYDN